MRGFRIVSRLLPMVLLVAHGGCGQNAAPKSGNRAIQNSPQLQSMEIDSDAIDLASARDPAQPTNSALHASGDEPIVIWIDVHVPPEAAAGQYSGSCDLLSRAGGKPIASIPISLSVDDFVLPDD